MQTNPIFQKYDHKKLSSSNLSVIPNSSFFTFRFIFYLILLILFNYLKYTKSEVEDLHKQSNNSEFDFILTATKALYIFLNMNYKFTDLVIISSEENLPRLLNFQFNLSYEPNHPLLFMSIQTFLTFSKRNTNKSDSKSEVNTQFYGVKLIVLLLENEKEMELNIFQNDTSTSTSFKSSTRLIFYNENDKTIPKYNNLTSWFLTGVVKGDKNVNIYENYRPSSKSNTLVSNLKYSIHMNGINNSIKFNENDSSQIFSERSRSNFHKLPLRIAAVMDGAYAYDTNITIDKSASSNNNTENITSAMTYKIYDSFAVEILKSLEYTMNFTIELRVTDAWGHLVNNETWVGMILLLIRDEADLAISSTASLPFRRQMVDFNMATSEIRLTAFFRQPRSTSQTNALLAPFNWDFWMAILIWIMAGSLTLIYFRKIIASRSNYTQSEIDQLWDEGHCWQWAIGNACLQGFYNYPTIGCFRMVIIIYSFTAMLIYACYAGTLISFLSVLVEPIKSMGQLLSTDFVIAVENSPVPLKFLAESPNLQTKKLYDRRNLQPQYEMMRKAAKELTKGSFVFIGDHMNGYDSLNHDFLIDDACQMREIVIKNGEQKQSSMVNKNATFKRTIDFQILRMHEYGLVKHWENRYLRKKPVCEVRQHYEGVEFKSVSLSFLTLLIGFGITTVFLIFEFLASPFKTEPENSRSLFKLHTLKFLSLSIINSKSNQHT